MRMSAPDYLTITGDCWQFFVATYGGGPEFCLHQGNEQLEEQQMAYRLKQQQQQQQQHYQPSREEQCEARTQHLPSSASADEHQDIQYKVNDNRQNEQFVHEEHHRSQEYNQHYEQINSQNHVIKYRETETPENDQIGNSDKDLNTPRPSPSDDREHFSRDDRQNFVLETKIGPGRVDQSCTPDTDALSSSRAPLIEYQDGDGRGEPMEEITYVFTEQQSSIVVNTEVC